MTEKAIRELMEERYERPAWEVWLPLVGCILVIAAAIGLWVFASAMEARAYERITGKRVSTWDAMWVDLRVQEQPK